MASPSAAIAGEEITIVGAGLIGALLATVLATKGYSVAVYERYDDIRNVVGAAGRSINLVATARGLRALEVLPAEVKSGMLALGTKVTGRIIHTSEGEPVFQRYGKDDTEFNYSISRLELNKYLLTQAEKAGAKLHYHHSLVDIDLSGEYPTLTFDVNGTRSTVNCAGPLVAADGGGSQTRRLLEKRGLCSCSEELLDSGYKEMTFPKESAQAHALATHGLHIWPNGDHFLMGLANQDGSFTGTIYMANEGPKSFKGLEQGGDEAARAFLEQYYKSALPYLGGVEAAAAQLTKNPVGILGTVRTKDWAIGKQVVLIGDAAHAIVPFFGQGMNSGFEDVKDFAQLLDAHAPVASKSRDYEGAFRAFESARRPNANAIADMALENYHEMQSKTADPTFRLCKAVENALEKSELGARFRSRYAMVRSVHGRRPARLAPLAAPCTASFTPCPSRAGVLRRCGQRLLLRRSEARRCAVGDRLRARGGHPLCRGGRRGPRHEGGGEAAGREARAAQARAGGRPLDGGPLNLTKLTRVDEVGGRPLAGHPLSARRHRPSPACVEARALYPHWACGVDVVESLEGRLPFLGRSAALPVVQHVVQQGRRRIPVGGVGTRECARVRIGCTRGKARAPGAAKSQIRAHVCHDHFLGMSVRCWEGARRGSASVPCTSPGAQAPGRADAAQSDASGRASYALVE